MTRVLNGLDIYVVGMFIDSWTTTEYVDKAYGTESVFYSLGFLLCGSPSRHVHGTLYRNESHLSYCELGEFMDTEYGNMHT